VHGIKRGADHRKCIPEEDVTAFLGLIKKNQQFAREVHAL
jgi:hypothetical protein